MSNSECLENNSPESPKAPWLSSIFSQATRDNIIKKRKHITNGLQTATALGVILYYAYKKDPEKARAAIIKVATHSAWFAHATKKFPIIKKIDEEKFILGLSVVGMALSTPQLYDALMSGNYISKALSVAAIAAFNIRMIPPVEKFIREGVRHGWNKSLSDKFKYASAIMWTEEKFSKLGKLSDKFVHHHKISSKFFKHGPSVIVGATGLTQTIVGLLNWDMAGFATGMASLFGTALLVAAEFGMEDKKNAVEPSIFDPIEPIEKNSDDIKQKASNDNEKDFGKKIPLVEAEIKQAIPESAQIKTVVEDGVEKDILMVAQKPVPTPPPAPSPF